MMHARRYVLAAALAATVAGFGLGMLQPSAPAQACTRKNGWDDCGCYCDDGDEVTSCKTYKTGRGCDKGCTNTKRCYDPPPDDEGGGGGGDDGGGDDNGGGDSGGGIWT